MKKIIVGMLLSACLVNVVSAGSKTESASKKSKEIFNPVSIYNNTNTDIAYVMDGAYGGNIYGIKQGMSDVYHSGPGDEYATFDVGICKSMTTNGGHCTQYQSIAQCTNGHYNADLIKTIVVNSLSSCTVTCLDGSTTSCKQSG